MIPRPIFPFVALVTIARKKNPSVTSGWSYNTKYKAKSVVFAAAS